MVPAPSEYGRAMRLQLLLFALTLAACGGSTPAPETAPATDASASIAATDAHRCAFTAADIDAMHTLPKKLRCDNCAISVVVHYVIRPWIVIYWMKLERYIFVVIIQTVQVTKSSRAHLRLRAMKGQ